MSLEYACKEQHSLCAASCERGKVNKRTQELTQSDEQQAPKTRSCQMTSKNG